MKEFKKIFDKVNGFSLIKQYAKSHMLLFVIWTVLTTGFSKKNLEIVRLKIQNKVVCKLRKKYKNDINRCKESIDNQRLKRVQSNKVWVCWLQGIENAPELVQRCYKSLRENLLDREIILLTETNYKEFVQFPSFIQDKIDSGVITRTHFSDLLRIELLIKYGGTWIDSTVLCTGKNVPDYMLNSDLFFFQMLKPGLDGHAVCMSSWFITSCTNNPVLMLCRELLYKYWSKYNFMIDYFLLHDLFQLSLEAYPTEWKNVIPFDNAIPHILLLRLFEKYNCSVYEETILQTPFHKLSYKFSKDRTEIAQTYYEFLFKNEVNI